jgi:hypothetical protein
MAATTATSDCNYTYLPLDTCSPLPTTLPPLLHDRLIWKLMQATRGLCRCFVSPHSRSSQLPESYEEFWLTAML